METKHSRQRSSIITGSGDWLLLHERPTRHVAWFGAGTTILFWIVLLVLIRQIAPADKPSEISTQSPPSAARPKLDFAVAVEAGWLHPKSMDENFWLIRGDKKGRIIASPINGILYIRFTNLSDAPIMIDSYSIEVLNGKQG